MAALWGGLLILEARRPLRPKRESKLRRNSRNLALAAVAALTIQVVEKPIVAPLARRTAARRWGAIPRLGLPTWAERALGLALLDYTLFVWHILTHRSPLLWRFHAVHHADLDLDATTAVRFHAGELALSTAWRAAQVAGLGIAPQTLSLWQGLTMASIAFHHSNLRLPMRWERWLSYGIVTPRLHGIHHASQRELANSNWSSGLALWDLLHRTRRWGVPQNEFTIGVPALQRPDAVTFRKALTLPWAAAARQPSSFWQPESPQPSH